MLVQSSDRCHHLKKVPAIFLKLDVACTFDLVSWQFLFEVLRAYGFSKKWIAWIKMILSSASSKVLVNGHPTERIWHGKGLWQGDPLSPLLFVIIMDVLGKLFARA